MFFRKYFASSARTEVITFHPGLDLLLKCYVWNCVLLSEFTYWTFWFICRSIQYLLSFVPENNYSLDLLVQFTCGWLYLSSTLSPAGVYLLDLRHYYFHYLLYFVNIVNEYSWATEHHGFASNLSTEKNMITPKCRESSWVQNYSNKKINWDKQTVMILYLSLCKWSF